MANTGQSKGNESMVCPGACKKLAVFVDTGHLAHALLFTGGQGVGKEAAALMMAKAVNCKSTDTLPKQVQDGPRYCDTCRSCIRISGNTHPDILRVEPEGTEASKPVIRIDRIRNLCKTLSMRPYEASMRVVIISDAHTMTTEASNALLKVLEEPPKKTMMILTARQTSDMLATIRSRCQKVRFSSPFLSSSGRDMLVRLLVENCGFTLENALTASALPDAGRFLKKGNGKADSRMGWADFRNWIIEAGGLEKSQPLRLRLAFSEKLSKKKIILEDALAIMSSWFRDVLIIKHVPDKIINKDLRQKIMAASKKTKADVLLSGLDAVRETENRIIRRNGNPRLHLDALMIKLAKSMT